MKYTNINLNDLITGFMLEFFEKKETNGMSKEETIESFANLCYENKKFKLNDLVFTKEYILTVLYCYSLKYVLYLHKTALVNDEVALLLIDLKSIEDKDDLYAELSANVDLFYKIIEYAYKYMELNILSKKIISKSLSNVELKWINRYFCSNLYDTLEASTNITIDDIVSELKDDNKYQEKLYGEGLSESNIYRIMGIINSLCIYDNYNYCELLLEIAKRDYAVCKYITDVTNDCEYAIDKVDLYENYSLDDIIESLMSNQYNLKSALWMIVSLYVDKDFEGIELPTDLMDTQLSPKMIKKLSFKNDDNEKKNL